MTTGRDEEKPPAASPGLPGGLPGGAAPRPLVDAGGNRTVSVEALLLWRHPLSGDGSSAEDVPLAEESPLIVDIGRQVLQRTGAGAAVPLLTGMAS